MAALWIQIALVAGAGLIAGLVSGLFGLGGGVVAVPAALWISDATFHEAKAASLMVIVFGSTIALARHHRSGNVGWHRGLGLASGGVLGSVASSQIATDVSGTLLGQAFGVLMMLVAVRMVVGEPGQHMTAYAWTFPALGCLAGLLTGFLGVGGGVIMVPGMALLGVPMHAAVATSLVGVVANGASAAITQAAQGLSGAMLTIGVPLAIGAMIGGRLGAKAALALPSKQLRRAFGVLLAIVGLRFLL